MQKQNELSKARQRIFDAISEKADNVETITSHRFNLVSANLFRFLPHLNFDLHKPIYREVMLHNQLTHFEQTQPDILHSITVENLSPELMQLMRKTPCILSSFHLGNYRLMNLFLTQNKVPYTIVIPKESMRKEGDIFKNLYQKMRSNASSDPIRFIELESPALSLKMMRELKQGRNLFIYFDGYRGAGKLQDNKRYGQDGQVNFLGQPLLARVGVAYLAQMAGAPLITGISYRKSLDDLRLKFFDPVFPDSRLTREQFAHDTTQALYDRLSSDLTAYPGQWEAWLYLHRSLPCPEQYDSDPLTPKKAKKMDHSEAFKVNHNKFGIFKIRQNAYLFNKKTYTTYPIDDEIFSLLATAIYQSISPGNYRNSAIPSLMKNEVIIPSAA
ncbi:MAG: hypothetical protein KF862_04250 [Chitinophagaceae bacterium]|nr:hypothetical protein [Chitinophagaceae bacterium]